MIHYLVFNIAETRRGWLVREWGKTYPTAVSAHKAAHAYGKDVAESSGSIVIIHFHPTTRLGRAVAKTLSQGE